MQPWQPAEFGRFLDAIEGDRLAQLFEVMRPPDSAAVRPAAFGGEAYGLRWKDVDLARGRVTVTWQLVQIAARHPWPLLQRWAPRFMFRRPKTRSGEARVVDLDSATVAVLQDLRSRGASERASFGDAYDDHALCFAHEDGRPLDPAKVTERFAELEKEAGVRHVKVHGLRHGQASLMLAAGVGIALVSKRLGHSAVSVTADVYSHLLDGVGREAAKRAAALIPRNRGGDQDVTSTVESGPSGAPMEGAAE